MPRLDSKWSLVARATQSPLQQNPTFALFFRWEKRPLLVAAGCHACVCVPWLGAICGCHGWRAIADCRSGARFLQGARCCGWVPQEAETWNWKKIAKKLEKHPEKFCAQILWCQCCYCFFHLLTLQSWGRSNLTGCGDLGACGRDTASRGHQRHW